MTTTHKKAVTDPDIVPSILIALAAALFVAGGSVNLCHAGDREERFHLQSECAEIGEKYKEGNWDLEKMAMKLGETPYMVTARGHYNLKDEHCYVVVEHTNPDAEKITWMLSLYDGQTDELLAYSQADKNHKSWGTIFALWRVPESALPKQMPFSEGLKDLWSENQSDRANAYVDYLMEENR
jgi:hypothetical protein